MAKKKAARKPTALKRKAPAKAKPKAPKAKAKPAKAKPKSAKKAVAKKVAPAAKKTAKPPVKAKPKAPVVVAKPVARPLFAPPKPVKPKPLGAVSGWDLRDVSVTFSQSKYITHIHYIRTNPEDCDVRIRYSSFHNGPLDNTISVPSDIGDARSSGRVQDWDALEIIPTGYRVSLQLCQNFAPMTPALEVVVQSVP